MQFVRGDTIRRAEDGVTGEIVGITPTEDDAGFGYQVVWHDRRDNTGGITFAIQTAEFIESNFERVIA